MATNTSKQTKDVAPPARNEPQATRPKSSDVALTIKLILFAAAFIAALWALDRFASM